MTQTAWAHDLLPEGIKLVYAAIGGAAAWGIRAWGERRRSIAEQNQRRRQLAVELLSAAGEVVGLVDAHRVEWRTPKEIFMITAEALGEIVRQPGARDDLARGLPAALGVVRKWDRAQIQAGRDAVIPAISRLSACFAAIVLLGDDALTQAAKAVVDATNAHTAAMAKNARRRDRARVDFDQAVGDFGRQAGLGHRAEDASPSFPRRLARLLRLSGR